MNRSITYAVGAAILFGVSTPAAKYLLGEMSPQLLAGLLYFGAGFGLTVCLVISKFRQKEIDSQEGWLKLKELPWLFGAVFAGGILAPVLLMIGLAKTTASTTSLLLNMESVFTAAMAWLVFKENFDKRILLGMILIVAGSCLLSWTPGTPIIVSLATLAIILACLCWGVDNNLTRKISGSNPLVIVAIKGLIAGLVNTSLAVITGARFPLVSTILFTGLIGFVCYGLSLSLFILALRHLGTGRTSAYFSIAPFAGAFLSIIFLGEPIGANFLIAALLMGIGVWLHLTERHEHAHIHEAITHEHRHVHDEHHQHEHENPSSLNEPHSHLHTHERIIHSHPHYPDINHRHTHDDISKGR